MAHQDGADKGASGIARVGKRKWGYDPDQVDAFLDRAHALYESEDAHLTQQDIQNVSFDLSKGGYDITQVDAALSRLEQAVVDKQTTREITEHGRVAWKAQTEELYRQVCEHADRGTGERFARGHDRRPSYDRKQVDRLIDQIVDKAAAGLGVDGVSEQDVRKLADLSIITSTRACSCSAVSNRSRASPIMSVAVTNPAAAGVRPVQGSPPTRV